MATALKPIISETYRPGYLSIVSGHKSSSIVVGSEEWPGVVRAAKNLQSDIEKVSGVMPSFSSTANPGSTLIIVGTIGHSELVDAMIKDKKIDVSTLKGKWESTLIQVVKNPMKGVDSALVIVGSDKRGTIYGIYELSYQIGVSPWYYWADVPVKKKKSIFVAPGRHLIPPPAVKYRGIFLNDEAPALSGWSRKTFGGFNHNFYEKVFELLLRLKGNYLWPAMWGSAFNDDDKLNPLLADEYGIVMGTSHHEPMVRSQTEWKRFGKGKWNYELNKEVLSDFWQKGIENMGTKESIVTIGMRGDGDEPMTEGTATALLERIVSDQREIIAKVSGKPAAQTPQLWALYKEVQDYYDKGMRVPDDITLLLCDDNWGNIRKLPRSGEKARSGGYGIYYHYDYVGGPRNYKWLNTNPIQKVWEQMHLAFEHKANQIWIVNVGDLKPMEFPVEFFLDYAWAPDAIQEDDLLNYTTNWAGKQFGKRFSAEIATYIDTYLKFSGRIKPELLNESTYSLTNYNEFERVTLDFRNLYLKAQTITKELPAEQQDAYYQLVLHPIEALGNLYELYLAVAKNHLYFKQGRWSTNQFSVRVDSLFEKDEQISKYYNKTLSAGKWDHMMDQTHIGYTTWQQPEKNIKPKTFLLPDTTSNLGVAVEGSEDAWKGRAIISHAFPKFSSMSNNSRYIEIFNTGKKPISFKIEASEFLQVSEDAGILREDKKIIVNVNWSKVAKGIQTGEVRISGSDGANIVIPIELENRYAIPNIPSQTFFSSEGYISMEATHFSKKVNKGPITWKILPNYGKTLGGITPHPVTSAIQHPGGDSPHLAYSVIVKVKGTHVLNSYVAPTIDFSGKDGLKFAISVDDEAPVLVNISEGYDSEERWGNSVINNIKIFQTPLNFKKAGHHTIKYWMVSPGVVLEKLVLDVGGMKQSFLGPPESPRLLKAAVGGASQDDIFFEHQVKTPKKTN